ncbi:hypothetical protein [Micromonospora zhanjiangensis]|uniref:Uncharacterized protein n=1 Tax=Micromonospora zhanjiangensis TaxID=1522057 RepID=A0ABV8KLI5_9ACTN
MIVEARFNGPPNSGNGGYAAGIFAAAPPAGTGPAEVTLRRPPPLATPLTVVAGADTTEVRDPDGELVAEVRRVEPFDATVPTVPRATAVEASADYPGFVDHPFPTCYVCGPEHPDGLRIFPGRLPDGRTAAPFRAPADVTRETVWAALDCPGGWAVLGAGRPYVLGRIAAVVEAVPAPGDECVVTGRLLGTDGRKALAHSTLYGADGSRLGHARATWIAV